jgi:hypothetical protein
MIKDDQDSDRPHAHEAQGLDHKKPNPERKKAGHATIREHSSKRTYKKTSQESKHSTEDSGATPGGCARAPPLEKTMTLRLQFINR